MIAHTTAFVTPVVDHWLEREIAQWAHPMKDRSDDPSHHELMLLPQSYISLLDEFTTNRKHCDTSSHSVLFKDNLLVAALFTPSVKPGALQAGGQGGQCPGAPRVQGIPTIINPKINIGLGDPHCSLSMDPRGSCYDCALSWMLYSRNILNAWQLLWN